MRLPIRQAISINVILLATNFVPHVARAQQNPSSEQFQFIPAGQFWMGESDTRGFNKDHVEYNNEDEQPRHPVRLTAPFYLLKTEVTVAQFRRFAEATGYTTTAEKSSDGPVGFEPEAEPRNPRFRKLFRRDSKFTWKDPGFAQGDDHPVVCVSWHDAQAYCQWLTKEQGKRFRLPTEAEWEYACRGGTDSYFSFGDQHRGEIHRHANIADVELEKAHPFRAYNQWIVDAEKDPDDGHVYTAPVGSYQANAFGLHDMHGNVWELCEDLYLDTFYKQYNRKAYSHPMERAIDPLNASQKWNDFGEWRVIRGGSWLQSPVQSRSAVRSYFDAPDAACYVGFRVVREAEPSEIAAAKKTFEDNEAARRDVESAIGRFYDDHGGTLEARFNDLPAIDVFEKLAKVEGLTGVQLNGGGKVQPDMLRAIAAIPELTKLTMYNTGGKILDDDLAALARCRKLASIHLFVMSEVGDAGIAHLAKLTNLTQLSLEAPKVTDAALTHVATLANLRELSITVNSTDGDWLRPLAKTPLESLSITRPTDSHAAAISTLTSLHTCNLRGGTITDAGFSHLKALSSLQRLDLADCKQITDQGVAPLSAMTRLTSINLRQTAAGDHAAASLAGLKNLSSLEIGSNTLKDAGINSLCEIASLNTLTITKDAVNVTDAGLSQFWRLNQLDTLWLDAPNITGAGLAPLAELKNLNRVRISSSKLTDAAFAHLAWIPNLRDLQVGNNDEGSPAITDAGLLNLVDSENLQSLMLIRKGTAITDQGIETLRERSPNLRINVR